MSRYVIVEEKPIVGRPENWSEKCERENMESAAKSLGIELRAAEKPAAPAPKPAAKPAAQPQAPAPPAPAKPAAPAQPAAPAPAAPGAGTEG